ncbi:hypothetical protein [Acinetobacter tibetensis]|uniref:Uncharacterized protein n=1 Tax=Acinetobacter tibetensis TaxID=2943497 RepID=A0AAE9LTD8_9GAMM|nr:hypothetical protein [Acinetobacter tibetensis]USE84363.1 hypothetical protein M5E07_06065 [Acinetobacter tibetensis]
MKFESSNRISTSSVSKISTTDLVNYIDGFINHSEVNYNELYKIQLKKKFEPILYKSLRDPFVEDEELLSLSYELKLHLKLNFDVTSNWLSEFYLSNLSKENILSNLLRLLALIEGHLLIFSIVVMIAQAVSIKFIQVKRSALQLLESLILEGRNDAYSLLNQMDVIKQPRLEKYRQAILADNRNLMV